MKRYLLASILPFVIGAVTSPAKASPLEAAPVPVRPPVQPANSGVPATPKTTIFKCVQSGKGYATVVSNGAKQATLITWSNTAFGTEFSPQVRCNMVSQKFQTVVARNGGKLRNLLLTVGTIGNQTVVCAINQGQYGCNSNNMLFTLNPKNAKNPGAALAKILLIGNYGSGGPLNETTELPEFNLEELVDQALGSAPESTDASTAPPVTPTEPSIPTESPTPTEPSTPVAPVDGVF